MDQTNQISDQTQLAPLALRVITLLGLIGAVIGILASAGGVFLFGFSAGLFSLLAIFALAKNVFLFVALMALRKMKKWAFYVFGIIALLNVILLITSYSQNQIIEVVVEVIFFVYLWTLRKRFV